MRLKHKGEEKHLFFLPRFLAHIAIQLYPPDPFPNTHERANSLWKVRQMEKWFMLLILFLFFSFPFFSLYYHDSEMEFYAGIILYGRTNNNNYASYLQLSSCFLFILQTNNF